LTVEDFLPKEDVGGVSGAAAVTDVRSKDNEGVFLDVERTGVE
jgi:hypothetical protein